MESDIPRLAERAERLVLRVLFVASRSGFAHDEIRHAASAIRLAPQEPLPALSLQDGEQLKAAAQEAYRRRGDLAGAIDLLTRALAANPLDSEVAGTLASLRLRHDPAHADLARRLALYALTTRHARHPYGRLEDWTTFAIASALSGRERDARNAWFVTLALAPDVQRQCRVAADAHARYGERVRASVEAMLQQVQASGPTEAFALCEWPAHWQR